eukprot:TRINITY_DN893_c4_g1_i1.p1 TRINITY_DN893_c4_g1~~TRINITY_DN893_c4_g1_i1.p1  ORF type:complete len:940 (+),score=334.89 TRINITY_DN893_c4_g1_i1:147-2966(+)
MGYDKKTGKNRLDRYYRQAKEQGYRSRASYKLIQLNKKFNFLSKARTVLDLCAAPGSWLQVASKYMPVARILIGVDLDPIRKIPHCQMLQQDITTTECRTAIRNILGNETVDVVLHDGAPNMGKAWIQDAYSQAELVLSSLKLATVFLSEGGWFVTKVFRSADYNNLMWVFNHFFKKVTATKPAASRAVSAEIFVVCEGYLKPAKIDPKLLDPRHVFKEIKEDKKPVDIFSKSKAKRHRDGYDTDGVLLFTKESVARFIEAPDPVNVLAQYNTLVFEATKEDDDAEEIAMYLMHPATTEEVKACLADLKVLNHKDFRGLLKWRQKIREFAQIGKYNEEEKAEKAAAKEEGIELTQEQKDNLLQQEMDDILYRKNRKKKKLEKKKLKLSQRYAMRMGANTNMNDEAFEAPQPEGLFSLGDIRSASSLTSLTGNAGIEDAVDEALMDDNYNVLEKATAEEIEEKKLLNSNAPLFTADDFSSDASEGEQRTAIDEQYLDLMWDNYLVANIEYKKKIRSDRKVARALGRKSEMTLPDDLTDFDKYVKKQRRDAGEELSGDEAPAANSEEEEESDVERPSAVPRTNRLLVGPDAGKVNVTSRAQRWFGQNLFEGVEGEEEEQLPEGLPTSFKFAAKSAKKVVASKIDGEAEDPLAEFGVAALLEKDDAEEDAGETYQTKLADLEKAEARKDLKRKRRADMKDKRAAKKQKLADGEDAEEFAEVPLEDEISESSGEESSDSDDMDIDPDGYDSDERAEILAMGAAMHDPTRRAKMIDKSINRYSYNDGAEVPRWFNDEEKHHNKIIVPVTKEQVAEYKMQLKNIDARSTKKVAEASARKKKMMLNKLEKAKSSAKVISANSELSERDKVKQIQKLYKGSLSNMKTNKVYIAGGKVQKNAVGGKARIKLVDKRMLADKRGLKLSTKKATKKSHNRNSKRAQAKRRK